MFHHELDLQGLAVQRRHLPPLPALFNEPLVVYTPLERLLTMFDGRCPLGLVQVVRILL